MSARFYSRTEPGEPADWRDRAIVGRRARRVPVLLVFAIGVLLGWLAGSLG